MCCYGIWASPLPQAGGAGGGPEMAEGVPRRGAENAEGMTEEEADLSAGVLTEAEALAEAESGMAQMSKVYDKTGRELYMGAGDREHD